MNRFLIILLTLIFFSCGSDDDIEVVDNSPVHGELGFELDVPEIILNELAKGKLDRNINSILSQMFDNFPEPAERYWEFEYMDNSDQVSQMTFYLPHYAECEKEKYKFYYNQENLIKSIVSKRVNLCNQFEVDKVYTFNYNENGLLKSIYMDNDFSVEENYFGYYPNGKVKEIYNGYRGYGEEIEFYVQKFYYDATFSNIVMVDHAGPRDYHYTYQYFYDTNENPYKDFFAAVSVSLPMIGPAYLSKNNVVKMIKKNENNIYGEEFTFEYLFNYSNNGTLESYSDMDQNTFPYHLYSINP